MPERSYNVTVMGSCHTIGNMNRSKVTKHKSSAVDKPKFMGRPPDHPWWKTGLPKSFLGCPNYFYLPLKETWFLVFNTKFACFLFNHVPPYRAGSPSSNLGGSCWIARPSNGLHLVTERPLIHGTVKAVVMIITIQEFQLLKGHHFGQSYKLPTRVSNE